MRLSVRGSLRRTGRGPNDLRAKAALAALSSYATLSELVSPFDVHAHQIGPWKRQLVAQAAEVFTSDGVRQGAAPPVDLDANLSWARRGRGHRGQR